MKELVKIQSELKAPKGQRNKHMNFQYRSCERIREIFQRLLSAELHIPGNSFWNRSRIEA